MDNPYYEEFQELQEQHTFRGQTWFEKRQELVTKYSWAVPTEDIIRYISSFEDTIYDLGAGSGYWARLCQEFDADVEPVDADPPKQSWTQIVETDARAYFDQIPEGVVLLVWPPYDGTLALNVAQQSPAHILYVGERRVGCTASDEFFDVVQDEYGLVGHIEIPSYQGIHDDFYHYVRKI
jgi:hypothetical protein